LVGCLGFFYRLMLFPTLSDSFYKLLRLAPRVLKLFPRLLKFVAYMVPRVFHRLHGYYLRPLSKHFHSLLGEFLGYILILGG
jgi:hypothetical protein